MLASLAVGTLLLTGAGGGGRLDIVAQAKAVLAPAGHVVHLVTTSHMEMRGGSDAEIVGPEAEENTPRVTERWSTSQPTRWRVASAVPSVTAHGTFTGSVQLSYGGGTEKSYIPSLGTLDITTGVSEDTPRVSLSNGPLGTDPVARIRSMLEAGQLHAAGTGTIDGHPVKRLVGEELNLPLRAPHPRWPVEYDVDPTTYAPVRFTVEEVGTSFRGNTGTPTEVVDVNTYQALPLNETSAALLSIHPAGNPTVVHHDREREELTAQSARRRAHDQRRRGRQAPGAERASSRRPRGAGRGSPRFHSRFQLERRSRHLSAESRSRYGSIMRTCRHVLAALRTPERGRSHDLGRAAAMGRDTACDDDCPVERQTGADALAYAIEAEPIETIPETSAAERAVADLHAIGASRAIAERVRDSVPLWFHTFALAPGVYTPGVARDHGYRVKVLDEDRFAGRSVLDVGAFDGFYSFLAAARGASRVVAVDNEQYVDWVQARFGVELSGGAGFRAVAELIESLVEYRRMDALDVRELHERFDVVLCFGILHRVTDPIALLRALADVLTPGGEVVLETYGSRLSADAPAIEVHEPGDVYSRDDFVYWGFSAEALRRLGRIVGLDEMEVVEELDVDGHPRILAVLRAAA